MTSKKKDNSVFLAILFIVIAIIYLLFSFLRTIEFDNLNLDGIKVCNTIFISIIMQDFPFMLIGVFEASTLHVFGSHYKPNSNSINPICFSRSA